MSLTSHSLRVTFFGSTNLMAPIGFFEKVAEKTAQNYCNYKLYFKAIMRFLPGAAIPEEYGL